MAGKTRREEYAELTRAAVVTAATARFAADGYAATTIDAIAADARVTKGGIYHHFADKAELFEAAFVAMEERLLAKVTAGLAGIEDPLAQLTTCIDLFLSECTRPEFRRIALEEAPAALGWTRWKKLDESFFLGLVRAGLDGLARTGDYDIPAGDLTARILLAALGEAGLAVAAAPDPDAELAAARTLLRQFLLGLRRPVSS
jgi:AcrR family transcriptional regulator